MAYNAYLLMDGDKLRDLLNYGMQMIRPEGNETDQIVYNQVVAQMKIVPGPTLLPENRRTGPPCETLMGPLLYIEVEAGSHDRYFYDWAVSHESRKGEIMVFRYDDEHMPLKRYKFWDGYLINLSTNHSLDAGSPVKLEFLISAAVLDLNGMEFKNTWHETDPHRDSINPFAPGFQKAESVLPPVAEEEEELTEVAVIKLMETLEKNAHTGVPGLRLGETYHMQVDSYTRRERLPSETVKWCWGYIASGEDGKASFKELGSHEGDEILTFTVEEEAQGKDLIFYAWLYEKDAARTRVYVDPSTITKESGSGANCSKTWPVRTSAYR